jgi:ADP-ribose pyrophosphatase YjhB (NUDIX family)
MLIKLAYRLLRIYWFLFRPVTMGVRAILFKDEQFVLVKHSYQDAWFLPGGGVKRRETLEQAIRRETAEECGATLHDVRFIGTYTNFVEYRSDHVSLFLSKDFTFQQSIDHEIEMVKAFPLQQLPANTSPGSQGKITAYINESLEPNGMW